MPAPAPKPYTLCLVVFVKRTNLPNGGTLPPIKWVTCRIIGEDRRKQEEENSQKSTWINRRGWLASANYIVRDGKRTRKENGLFWL